MSPANSCIRISNLNKRFGNTEVLRNLNLSVTSNSIHGLIGLNGSGKTTTIECLLGLQPFQTGSIKICATSPDRVHTLEGRVAAVFDTPNIYPNLTVRQNLEYVKRIIRRPKRNIGEVQELLGITRYKDYKSKKLSFGNKRRLSIAQALLGGPELVVFDEPFNGLDAQGVEDVLEIVRTENHEFGTTFLLASHQFGYLEEICTEVSVLHNGRIKSSGELNAFLDTDQHEVLIRSRQSKTIAEWLSGSSTAEVADSSVPEVLRVRLSGISAAEINATLVHAGFDIDELVQQKKSLRDVFQAVTRLRDIEAKSAA